MPQYAHNSLLLTEIKKDCIAIPSGYIIDSNVRSKGDCFFDAVAKYLQIINNDTSIAVKSLRIRCQQYLQQQLKNIETKQYIPKSLKWIIDCLKPEDTQYKSALAVLNEHIIQIQFSEEDFSDNQSPLPSLKTPIWGDINLEGRIICTLYHVVLYILEKQTYDDNKTIWCVQRIDQTGTQTRDLPNPIEKQDIILVNEGRNHFMPLLHPSSTGVESHHHKLLDEQESDGNDFTYTEDSLNVSISLNNNGQLLPKYRKIDVPGDSCLFWPVALAYLTPVKDDYNVFKTRFQKLFGHQNHLNTVQKCIQKYDYNIPHNGIFKHLVTQDFRNIVCDYILDNKKRFNFQDPLFNNKSNKTLDDKELADHIQQIRNTITWGTCLKQEAMALMLECHIYTYSNAQTYQVYPIVNQSTYGDKLVLHFVNSESKNYDSEDMSNSSDTIYDNYESLEDKHYVISNIDNSNSEQENDQEESASSEEESTRDINDNEGNNIDRISPNNDDIANNHGYTSVHYLEHLNLNTDINNMCLATMMGDISVINTLLTKGVDVNALDHKELTALHYAATNGYNNIVNLLLDHGANVNATTPDKWTALHLAAYNKHIAVIKVLLDTELIDINISNNHGYTSAHYLEHLNTDVNNTQCECVENRPPVFILPQLNNTVVERFNFLKCYNYPMHWISDQILTLAKKKHYDKIITIVNNIDTVSPQCEGDNRLNARDSSTEDNTISSQLSYSSEEESTYNEFDNEKYKSLHNAVKEGDIPTVTTLLTTSVDVNSITSAKWTALHYAARNGDCDIVKLAYDHGANVNVITPDGWTALHFASSNGHDDIVKFLLNHGANVNVITPDGWTALHYAAKNKHIAVIKVLLDTELIDINISNNNGNTPYNLAQKEYYCTEIINLFQSKQHTSETASLKTNNTVISNNLADCRLQDLNTWPINTNQEIDNNYQENHLNQIIPQDYTQSSEDIISNTDSESESNYTLSSNDLDSNSDYRSKIQTRACIQSLTLEDQEKNINEILKSYNKFNISVEVAHDGSDENTLDHYKITNIFINRTSKHNDNHTVPLSFFCYSLKYLLKDLSINDAISNIDLKYINQFDNDRDWCSLLDEYKQYISKWAECNSHRICQDSIKIFLQEKIVPYIVYRWNTRMMSVFKEKKSFSEYGREGNKIKKFLKQIFSESKEEPENILNGADNLIEIENRIQDLLTEFLKCIDLPKDSAEGIAIILRDARELFYVLLYSIERSTNNSIIYYSSGFFTKEYAQLHNTILDKENFVKKFRIIVDKYNDFPEQLEQLECEFKTFLMSKALSIFTKFTDTNTSSDPKLFSPNTHISSNVVEEPENIDYTNIDDQIYDQHNDLNKEQYNYYYNNENLKYLLSEQTLYDIDVYIKKKWYTHCNTINTIKNNVVLISQNDNIVNTAILILPNVENNILIIIPLILGTNNRILSYLWQKNNTDQHIINNIQLPDSDIIIVTEYLREILSLYHEKNDTIDEIKSNIKNIKDQIAVNNKYQYYLSHKKIIDQSYSNSIQHIKHTNDYSSFQKYVDIMKTDKYKTFCLFFQTNNTSQQEKVKIIKYIIQNNDVALINYLSTINIPNDDSIYSWYVNHDKDFINTLTQYSHLGEGDILTNQILDCCLNKINEFKEYIIHQQRPINTRTIQLYHWLFKTISKHENIKYIKQALDADKNVTSLLQYYISHSDNNKNTYRIIDNFILRLSELDIKDIPYLFNIIIKQDDDTEISLLQFWFNHVEHNIVKIDFLHKILLLIPELDQQSIAKLLDIIIKDYNTEIPLLQFYYNIKNIVTLGKFVNGWGSLFPELDHKKLEEIEKNVIACINNHIPIDEIFFANIIKPIFVNKNLLSKYKKQFYNLKILGGPSHEELEMKYPFAEYILGDPTISDSKKAFMIFYTTQHRTSLIQGTAQPGPHKKKMILERIKSICYDTEPEAMDIDTESHTELLGNSLRGECYGTSDEGPL